MATSERRGSPPGSLPARDGGRVAVHPLHFTLLTRDPQVREFQVVQDGPVLRTLIVPSQVATASDDPLEARLGQAVAQQLLGLGVHDPQVTGAATPLSRRQAQARDRRSALRPVHTNTR